MYFIPEFRRVKPQPEANRNITYKSIPETVSYKYKNTEATTPNNNRHLQT